MFITNNYCKATLEVCAKSGNRYSDSPCGTFLSSLKFTSNLSKGVSQNEIEKKREKFSGPSAKHDPLIKTCHYSASFLFIY